MYQCIGVCFHQAVYVSAKQGTCQCKVCVSQGICSIIRVYMLSLVTGTHQRTSKQGLCQSFVHTSTSVVCLLTRKEPFGIVPGIHFVLSGLHAVKPAVPACLQSVLSLYNLLSWWMISMVERLNLLERIEIHWHWQLTCFVQSVTHYQTSFSMKITGTALAAFEAGGGQRGSGEEDLIEISAHLMAGIKPCLLSSGERDPFSAWAASYSNLVTWHTCWHSI